jgi:hypothetical protein
MDKNEIKNTFSIYQLKRGDEFRGIRFEPLYRLEAQGRTVSAANYQRVYEGPFEDGLTLEDIYSRFNTQRPKDFYGHSLSVSDVVVLKRGVEEKAFYCNSVGFSELPDFRPSEEELTLPEPPKKRDKER